MADPGDGAPLGDPEKHLDAEALERGLGALHEAPTDRGRVALIVARAPNAVRETPARVRVAPETGVPGDRWARQKPDRPEMQLAVMRDDVARLIANGQRLTLFGDNLFTNLDLSTGNLPAGTRLRAGEALLEVTPAPHNGCPKFRQRFGDEALRLTAREDLRDRHLRGIYMRVVEAGDLAVGDPIEVLSRPSETA